MLLLRRHAGPAFGLLLLALGAATFGAMPQWTPAGALIDPSFASALAAMKRGDWKAVVADMTEVVERRPWDDDAHNLLGFGYRKQGDYKRALVSYEHALELNPYHRGALEYLGEAYVEIARIDDAMKLLDRLEGVCRSSAIDESSWRESCEEWHELRELIDDSGKGD